MWSFYSKLEISVAWKFQLLRNLRYLGINNFIQSYILKNTVNMKETSSQHLLKMNRNI